MLANTTRNSSSFLIPDVREAAGAGTKTGIGFGGALMNQPLSIKDTIAVINQMRADGVIGEYAIGGAVAATFYAEPAQTYDVDVFVALNPTPGQLLLSLEPIFDYLDRAGHIGRSGEHVVIFDWQVQFLPPDSPLVEEAISQAVEKNVENVPVRVFTVEHLAAIALKLGRPKDKLRLLDLVKASEFNGERFDSILLKHGLLERWAAFKSQFID